jgi:thymidylate kinase
LTDDAGHGSGGTFPVARFPVEPSQLDDDVERVVFQASAARWHDSQNTSAQGGIVVLSDRYIFSALARARVRGVDRAWLRSLYGFAIAPHLVFYLKIDVDTSSGGYSRPAGWISGNQAWT